jgi:glycosyltransferase involved in cell wall biosynthesis
MTVLGLYLLNGVRTGGDRRYLELMELLAERGNTVIVIMNTFFDYTPTHFKKITLPVRYVLHRPPPASFRFKRALQKNLRQLQKTIAAYAGGVDFIHIHGDTHLKAALFLKRALKLPLFYAFRCNDIDRACILRASGSLTLKERVFSRLYEPVNCFREKQVARYAELITFQNSADCRRFIERTDCDKTKTVIIPGNIGPPRCLPEWRGANKTTHLESIVYVGALSATKGFWDLLDALALLRGKGLTRLCCCALGNTDNCERTIAKIEKLGLKEQVSLKGYQNPFPYLAKSGLMVYPTLYDAFPDTVLETLHTGCPVIASCVGGLPDMLRYPELLFDSGDVAEIASRIERCVMDTAYYQRLRSLCTERAAFFRFDWAERFENAMKEKICCIPLKDFT